MSAYQQVNIGYTGSLAVIIGPMVATAALFVLLPLLFSNVNPPSAPEKKPLEIELTLKDDKAPPEMERRQEETMPMDLQRQQQPIKKKDAPSIEPAIEGPMDNIPWTISVITEDNPVKNTEVEFSFTQSLDPPVFTIQEVDLPPRVFKKALPQYPTYARDNLIEGRVVIKFIVDRDGNVIEPHVTQSEPEGVFDDAAIEAIRKYRFKPAEKNGTPVRCIVIVPMAFQLR